MTYRPLAIADTSRVAALEARVYDYPWSLRSFEEALASGYDAWLGECADELAAYAILMWVVDEAHLLNLVVEPKFQRVGLGHAMLGFAIARARMAGMNSMLLEVRLSNVAARSLYRAAGFDEIGTRRGYYPARHGREDAQVMRLIF